MTEEQHIQRGFNAGYRLQQLQPEFASKLQQGFQVQDHPYAKAFIAGSEQYVQESSKSKSSYLDNYFNKIKDENKGKSEGKGKDKGIDL